MKSNFVLFAAAAFAVTSMTSAAIAAPKAAKKAAKASATLKCPACGMPMPMKKSAMATVPVKVGGKTYYCCAQCPAGKKAAAAATHGKKKAM